MRYFAPSGGSGSGGGSSDLLSVLTSSPVSVTGAVSLTSSAFGKLHVCTGTSANYAVTLPATAGNAGKLIGLRMAPGLTKLVTLTQHATDLIDLADSQVMWASETAILLTDGTDWFKVAGRAIAMRCQLRLSGGGSPGTAQTIPGSFSNTKVAFNVTDKDNTGAMADLTNHQVIAPRTGSYRVDFCTALGSSSEPIPRFAVYSQQLRSGSQVDSSLTEIPIYNTSSFATVGNTKEYELVAGDAVASVVNFDVSASQFLYGDPTATPATLLGVVELPSW